MKKRRIIWGCLLMLFAANAVFSYSEAGLYLFLGILLIPLMGILLTAACIKGLDVSLELQSLVVRGNV